MRNVVTALLLAGCASTDLTTPPPEGAKNLRVECARHTPLSITYYSTIFGSDSTLYSPSLRFDLSAVPKDAVVRRATLRLRREWEDSSRGPRSYPIDVTNVNKGLRVTQARVSAEWKQAGEILAGELVSGEDAIWGEVPGTPYTGMHLAQAAYNKQTYLASLKAWNPTVSLHLKASVEWDEIDVTPMVVDELKGDRSITLLLSSASNINLRWSEGDPHLVVSYDVAGEIEKEKPKAVAGKILLRSTPAPAKVYVDGEFVGTTIDGQEIEVAASGRATLKLVKPGFKAWEEKIKIGDAPVRIHAELEKD